MNVSEIGYGMWTRRLTGSDDAESLDALQRAVDLAAIFRHRVAYGEGRSEQILGKVLRDNAGKKLYVATKIPPKNLKWPAADFTLDDCIRPTTSKSMSTKASPTSASKSSTSSSFTLGKTAGSPTNVSARRGKVAYHRQSRSRRRQRQSLEPYNGIRAVLEGWPTPSRSSTTFSTRIPRRALPICRMKNVAVIARVPFDEGTLTGTLTVDSTWRKTIGQHLFCPGKSEEQRARAEALRPLVPAATPWRRWRCASSSTIRRQHIIPGMRKRRNVEANITPARMAPPRALHKQLRNHRWDRNPTSWSQ